MGRSGEFEVIGMAEFVVSSPDSIAFEVARGHAVAAFSGVLPGGQGGGGGAGGGVRCWGSGHVGGVGAAHRVVGEGSLVDEHTGLRVSAGPDPSALRLGLWNLGSR